MGQEIERKFLVRDDGWRAAVDRAEPFRQGYIRSPDATVRVRIRAKIARICVKGRTRGVSRSEWEYEVPLDDAREMLDEVAGGGQVVKTRHFVEVGGKEWVIDEFEGDNAGLVMAEIELEAEDEAFDLPSWAGDEVSDDPRYYNAALAQRPFTTW